MKLKTIGTAAIIALLTIFSKQDAHAIDTILRVAYEPNLPPYQFLEKDFHAGIHIDVLNSIAKNNKFIMEYIPMKTTTECIDALSEGKVDIVLGINPNWNYKYNYLLTENISESYICVVAPNEKLGNLSHSLGINSITASLEDGSIRYSYIQNMRNLKYIVSSNQVNNFNVFIMNKSDILIGVKHSIMYQLEKAKLSDKYTIINNYISSIEYSMAVRQGNEELLKKLNEGILKLRVDGEYDDIYNKWINEEKYEVNKILKKIFLIILAFILVLIFNIRINRLLQKQVNQKTKELQKINKDLEKQMIETRNHNELKNCIVENSPSSIVAFDTNYVITIFNKNAYKFSDGGECTVGKNIFEVRFLNTILSDKKDEIFLKGAEFINKGIVLKSKFNNDIHYRYSIYQLFDFNDNVRGAILSIDDITAEVIAREEIHEKEKNKALNQIIAGIAHEIRNPLMSIKTFAELIPVKKDSEHFQDMFSQFVPKEVERANKLIKNLIDYAKPYNENKEFVCVKDIIDSCTVLIIPILKDKKILLNTSIANGLTLFTNKNQLKQVLINIIFNSIQSIEEKIDNKKINTYFNVNIKAWEDEQNIFIQVEDEGMGMTQEQLKKSVEPFYTTKVSGTGIGLWMSKQYVEGNNGTMIIESKICNFTKVTLKFRRKA